MIKLFTAFSGGLAAPEFAMKYEEIEHEVIGAVEWDKYARQQYLHFHGEPKTFYKDIRDLDATQYRDEIDLFVWGSPCQDLSLAGKRKGFDGEKSSLFREGARVMSEMMPKCFIFENVKGLLSSNNGNDYKEVVSTFQKLGYNCTMQVMNTKDYGVPQNRERVFIVGFLDNDKHYSFEFEKPIKLDKRLRDILEDDVDEKYYLSDKSIKRLNKSERSILPGTKDTEYANCLIAQYNKIPTDGFYIKIKSATSKGYETATNEDSINFTHPDSKTRRGRVGKGVAQTLDCSCNQGIIELKQIGNIDTKGHNSIWGRVYSADGLGACLNANGGGMGAKTGLYEDNYRIRKLTPIEVFRLQGVKDEDIDLVVSNSQAYKIAGNAISVNVMQSILRSIYKNKSANLFSMGDVA